MLAFKLCQYPFTKWEQKREKGRERLRNPPKYVHKAADIKIGQTTGRPKNLSLEQRTMLFLFARLMNKSNRDIEEVLELFEPFFGFKVSYKYVERLYSNQEIRLVLHNLLQLLLEDERVSGRFAGDGTGCSLNVTRRYRSDPRKSGRDYRYVFQLIDVESGMYVGFGYSERSEMEAFRMGISLSGERGFIRLRRIH